MPSASKLILSFVLLLVATSSVTTVLGENQWTRYGSAPILSTPSWTAGGLIRPRVVYDGTTFRMWFTGLDAKANLVGIGYATSTDGMKWSENAQPVLMAGSSWEGNYISGGSVIWTGSEFMMWYRGVGGQAGSSQSHGAVGLATSPDGVAWTKYAGNPVMTTTTVDSNFLSTPYVIQVGSSFKMWYTCANPLVRTNSICYATSNDGKSWTKVSSPVLQGASGWESGGIFSPSVIYDGTTYGMWYSGLNDNGIVPQIGYATSKDGIAWTRDPSNPILPVGQSGAWDSGAVENECVVQYNGGFLLYYDGSGTSSTSLNYIGVAQSPPSFVLPETNSPVAMIAVATLIVLAGLTLNKSRLPGRARV